MLTSLLLSFVPADASVPADPGVPILPKAGSLKMNTALEYSTRVVQEGGRRCKKSTLNDLVHLTPLRIVYRILSKAGQPIVLWSPISDRLRP
jgi:hypothetical protein